MGKNIRSIKYDSTRRRFILNGIKGFAASGLLANNLLGENVKPQNKESRVLFYKPALLGNKEKPYSGWSNSIVYWKEKFIMAVPLRPISKIAEQNERKLDGWGFSIATSDDGVVWTEKDEFVCSLEHGVPGFCLFRGNEHFVLNITVRNRRIDREEYPVITEQYRSLNLSEWEYMGENYDTRPDKRWYEGRWDELVILQDGKEFVGYITSEPKKAKDSDSLGMLWSKDGIKWKPIPPPVIDWGKYPSQHMEVSFCEKIGNTYFLGMGARCYLGNYGYSTMVFRSKSAYGPFSPVVQGFRLCGHRSRDLYYLPKTFRRNGEILVSNWITPSYDKSFKGGAAMGYSTRISSLKKMDINDDGVLQLQYWGGNEKAKGKSINIDLSKTDICHPEDEYVDRKFYEKTTLGNNALRLKAGRDGMIVIPAVTLPIKKGIIIELKVKVKELRGHLSSHWHPAAGGLFFENEEGSGRIIQFETLGVTRIGRYEYASRPSFSDKEYEHAYFNLKKRNGPFVGLSKFYEEDSIGEGGYSAHIGARNERIHSIRVHLVDGVLEYYLDDCYVQTDVTGQLTGKVGFYGYCGEVEFLDVRMWDLLKV